METSEMVTKVQDAFELLGIPKQERSSDGNVYLDIKASDIYKSLAGQEISREKEALLRYTEAMEQLADRRVRIQQELSSIGEQFKNLEKMAEISRIKIDACEAIGLDSVSVAPAITTHTEQKHSCDGMTRNDYRSILLRCFHKASQEPQKITMSAKKLAKLSGLNEKVVTPCLYNQERSPYFNYFQRAEPAPGEREWRVSVYWKLTDKGYDTLISIL
jgi:hypothetical protein